jgi:hypothetical protein
MHASHPHHCPCKNEGDPNCFFGHAQYVCMCMISSWYHVGLSVDVSDHVDDHDKNKVFLVQCPSESESTDKHFYVQVRAQ